ncbi:unnamed protein product [Dracunculus medinensis]|uniref:Uncharacterized protein n=1 Tax=Dracunculus medinensis TaxID=318479 RepID=A0A0N4UJS8_DRAME|nr:unnamed protein product [Dracunculus medinensis]
MKLCECIPPPPNIELLSPPPDPSLIWHFISNEPIDNLEKINECDGNKLSINSSVPYVPNNQIFDYFPYLFTAIVGIFVIFIVIVVIIIINILRIRRFV